jgi:hypothetical protein
MRLERHEAGWATKLEDPVETATARSKSVAVSGYQDGYRSTPAGCHQRRQRVHFGVDIM